MMFANIDKLKIYIRVGKTDMRKQINGLSILVHDELELNPFEKSLFIFCNKPKNRLKILYWDRNGFCLWLKRLEKDKFPWPNGEALAKEITTEQLKMILDGIDFWNAHSSLKYSEIN